MGDGMKADLEKRIVRGADARMAAREVGRELALNLSAEFSRQDSPANGPVDVVDVFCGCGGLSAGFEAFGRKIPSFRLAGAVDMAEWAIQTYAANLPITPVRGDVSAIASSSGNIDEFLSRLSLRKGARKVLIGGPPCQGFSAHRKKDGKPKDLRNDLVRSFAAIAVRLRPEIVVMENVPELLAKKDFRQFSGFRETLESAGYVVRAEIHNLGGFGVPQERYRALVIASRVPFEMPSGFLDPKRFRTVRDAISHLPSTAPGRLCSSDPQHICTNHRQSTVDVIRRVPRDGGRRPAGVGPACLDRVDGFRDVYGRLYWDRPANTITGFARNPASGRYVHPEQHRGLTIREAAILQGFPDNYHFAGPFDHRFLQIGNAVPPAFAAYLAAHIWGELASVVPGKKSKSMMSSSRIIPASDSFSSGIAGRKRGSDKVCALKLL